MALTSGLWQSPLGILALATDDEHQTLAGIKKRVRIDEASLWWDEGQVRRVEYIAGRAMARTGSTELTAPEVKAPGSRVNVWECVAGGEGWRTPRRFAQPWVASNAPASWTAAAPCRFPTHAMNILTSYPARHASSSPPARAEDTLAACAHTSTLRARNLLCHGGSRRIGFRWRMNLR